MKERMFLIKYISEKGKPGYFIHGQSEYQNELNQGMSLAEAVRSKNLELVREIDHDFLVDAYIEAGNDINDSAVEGQHDREAWKRHDQALKEILEKYEIVY